MGNRSRRGSTEAWGAGWSTHSLLCPLPLLVIPHLESPVLPTRLRPALHLGLPGAPHLQPQTLPGLHLLQEAPSVSMPSVCLLLSRWPPAGKGDGSQCLGQDSGGRDEHPAEAPLPSSPQTTLFRLRSLAQALPTSLLPPHHPCAHLNRPPPDTPSWPPAPSVLPCSPQTPRKSSQFLCLRSLGIRPAGFTS